MNHCWQKAIILVDMNAFFASVEQLDFPQLKHQPVAVTNGKQGTCIITCSYEARAYGIKTGMRLPKALSLCPQLIQCSSRPKRYAEISTNIMRALEAITPDIEIYSVDEAFLDVTHCQKLHGSPAHMAQMTKDVVTKASGGLSCSVGVSANKCTAKFAAKMQKPDGLVVISPEQARARLAKVPVTQLWGISTGIGDFLAKYGVYYCEDMAKLPIGILAKRFGNLGRRIWYMCQGQDLEPMHLQVPAPKSMGHGKVIPPNTKDKTTIMTYLLHMSVKLAARLRHHQLAAQHYFIGLRSNSCGWIGGKYWLTIPANDSAMLFSLCKTMLAQNWNNQPISQVQLTALDPRPDQNQLDLFANKIVNSITTNKTIDAINDRYGEFAIAPARLLKRSSMPNVIAPSWKPIGHRQTI